LQRALRFTLVGVLVFSGCHAATSSLTDVTQSSQPGSIVPSARRPVSTHLFTNVRAGDTTPDGAYVIRQIHDPRLRLRRTSSYVASGGTFTQTEYSSPYGPVTLVQSSIHSFQPNNLGPTPTAPPNATLAQVVAQGTTTYGATWFVAAPNSDSTEYIVHVDFSDSSIDYQAPGNMSIADIKSLIASVY
jgi:hypothetical protein